MPYIEIAIACAIALLFFLLGHASARKRTDETKALIGIRVDEAVGAIEELDQGVSVRFSGIGAKLAEAHDKIKELPDAADKITDNSSRIVAEFTKKLGELGTSIEDLKAFSSTISLLEKNGFEIAVSKASPEQSEEIGKLPEKVFVLFPKRTLSERITDALFAGSASAFANKVADILAPTVSGEVIRRLDGIETRLDGLASRC